MPAEEEYFLTVLQLWKNYELFSVLKKANITPNSNKYYYTDDIKDAVSGVLDNRDV